MRDVVRLRQMQRFARPPGCEQSTEHLAFSTHLEDDVLEQSVTKGLEVIGLNYWWKALLEI